MYRWLILNMLKPDSHPLCASQAGLRQYRILRLVGGAPVQIATVPAGTLEYLATGLTQGQEEKFALSSENMLGQVSPLTDYVTCAPTVQTPSITKPASGASIATPTFTVSGKSEKGAQILMRVGAGGTPLLLGEVTDADGSFSFPATISLEGSVSLHFSAKVGEVESGARIVPITVNFKPDKPVGLAATGKDTWVLLQWTRLNTEDVASYNVYRDGNLKPLATVSQCPAGQVPQHRDLALTNGRNYSYRIQAVDLAGNTSDLSDSVSATPAAGPEWAP